MQPSSRETPKTPWAEGGDTYAILVADARRITLDQARTALRDACTAVTCLPKTLARLEAGDLPAAWFEQLLRRVRRLAPYQCRQLDDRVAYWDLKNIRSDRFSRELGTPITGESTWHRILADAAGGAYLPLPGPARGESVGPPGPASRARRVTVPAQASITTAWTAGSRR